MSTVDEVILRSIQLELLVYCASKVDFTRAAYDTKESYVHQCGRLCGKGKVLTVTLLC